MTHSSLKILVTGGAGFIGSAVIRHIIENTQDSVVNLDKLTYAGNLESLADVSNSERYAFEQVDICNPAELQRVFKEHQPDAVMHLAAESHVDRSIDGPAEFIQTNIVGTYTLLEAARAYWNELDRERKQAFRFHHISTDEVYGDLPHPNDESESNVGRASARQVGLKVDLHNSQNADPTDPVGRASAQQVGLKADLHNSQNADSAASVGRASARQFGLKAGLQEQQGLPLFTETTSYAPSSPYSASKASSDHLVRAWLRTYGFPTIITNCSNNYGPYHFPEKLIPLVILNALEGKPLPIYGKGDQIRDWLYVEDHARALFKVVTEGEIGETYNIGGHNEKQNIEDDETICEILDELRPMNNVTAPVGRASARQVGLKADLHISQNADPTDPVGRASARQVGLKADLQYSYKSLITYVTDRPGHDRRYAIDASKIAKELNWQPIETFESGIRKTVQWYLDNQQWCKNVQDGSYQRERLGAL